MSLADWIRRTPRPPVRLLPNQPECNGFLKGRLSCHDFDSLSDPWTHTVDVLSVYGAEHVLWFKKGLRSDLLGTARVWIGNWDIYQVHAGLRKSFR